MLYVGPDLVPLELVRGSKSLSSPPWSCPNATLADPLPSALHNQPTPQSLFREREAQHVDYTLSSSNNQKLLTASLACRISNPSKRAQPKPWKLPSQPAMDPAESQQPTSGDPEPQPQSPPTYVLDLGKPGDASCGRGVAETLAVIAALEGHSIPCCVVGTKALVYYGAHRVPMVSTYVRYPWSAHPSLTAIRPELGDLCPNRQL